MCSGSGFGPLVIVIYINFERNVLQETFSFIISKIIFYFVVTIMASVQDLIHWLLFVCSVTETLGMYMLFLK